MEILNLGSAFVLLVTVFVMIFVSLFKAIIVIRQKRHLDKIYFLSIGLRLAGCIFLIQYYSAVFFANSGSPISGNSVMLRVSFSAVFFSYLIYVRKTSAENTKREKQMLGAKSV